MRAAKTTLRAERFLSLPQRELNFPYQVLKNLPNFLIKLLINEAESQKMTPDLKSN